MLFAQFYQKSALGPELIESCGDRAVVIYDARCKQESTLSDASTECKKRGYVAFALFHGDTFTRSRRITSIQEVK